MTPRRISSAGATPRPGRAAGRLALAGALLLAACGTREARAQFRAVVEDPVSYRSWTVGAGLASGELRVTQLVAPVSVHARLGERVDLTTSFSAAGSALDPQSGTTTRLNGVSSVVSQLYVRLADDRVLLQTGLTLPTGTQALDAREVAVWEVMSLPVLGFPVRHYGRGFEWNGGLAVAGRVGAAGSGSVGAGVVLRAPYELIAGHEDYRPPSEFSATAGLDLGAPAEDSGVRPLRVDLTYRVLGTHEEDGRKVLREGNQLELQASGGLEARGFVGTAGIRLVAKGDYVPYDEAGNELDRLQGSSGTSISTRLACSRLLGAKTRVGVGGEWNALQDSDGYAQNGRSYGLGPFLACPLGSLADLYLEGSYLWGSLDGVTGAKSIDIHGTSLTASLRWGARP